MEVQSRKDQASAIRAVAACETAEDARAAAILAWARCHGILESQLFRRRFVRSVLDSATKNAAQLRSVAESMRHVTLKQVEAVFESTIDARSRKRQGAVYTPDFIIDALIENGLRFARPPCAAARFCDPACGSGGFLLRAIGLIARPQRLSLEETLSKCVRGIDNDRCAVQHARALVSMHLLAHEIHADATVERCIQHGDALLATDAEIRSLTGYESGIDLLATNPPYVKLQSLDDDYRAAIVQRYAKYTQGSYSLSLLFLIAGHRLLSRGGALAYITQNNFYTSLAAKSVRRFLQSQACIRRIVDFGHRKVFSGASAYTCLLFLANTPTDEFEFHRTTGPVTAASLQQATFSPIRHDTLDGDKWRLAQQPHLDHLRRIEHTGVPLGKLARISVGFATLKDSVFHLEGHVDSNSKTFQTLDGGEVELAATKRALRVSDADTESHIAANDRRIIFPYQPRDGRWRLVPEEQLREQFPKTHAYLLARRELLAVRDKGRRRYEAWYAWGRTQGRDAPGPKLLTKTFSSRPNFMLDKSAQLFCNGYSVFVAGAEEIRCLQRILNSAVMHYYAKLTSFQIEGNYQCYQKNFIERFGVPDLGDAARSLLTCPVEEADALVRELYGIPQRHLDEILQ